MAAEAAERLAMLEGFEERTVLVGSVRGGLLELAERVDLLIIGLHRRSLLGRLLRGSAADALVRELPCPLLAVPERLAGVRAAPGSTEAARPAGGAA
jgi:nucleotide-binding universal stress UspA family protein